MLLLCGLAALTGEVWADATNAAPAAVPAEVVAIDSVELKKVEVSPQNVPVFGRLEVSARIVPGYGNPFDPDEVRVDVRLESPSGKKRVAPGFLYARGQGEEGLDDWRVRFSPDEEGEWEGEFVLTTPAGVQATHSLEFKCLAPGLAAPIRVSRANPALFEKADGSYFYPLGHNVSWGHRKDYEYHFSKMHQNGENWSRIWIAAWNYEFEWSKSKGCEGLGRYNLNRAAQLDEILDLADRYGIYLQIVLHEHCRLATVWNPEWQNNPFNKALGGPLEKPQEFFTNPEAIRLARNRIRYIVARWGYSSKVMAWELFNEVSLVDDFNRTTDLAWHRDMARYIRSIDPHGRMITTSYSGTMNTEVFKLPEIDYTQLHVYDEEIIEKLIEWNRAFSEIGKPFFIGEFGRATEDGVDRKDRLGMFLHSGIWSQFMTPSGGSAMSWWWYDLIKPKDLYYRFGVLHEFGRGIDRRGAKWVSQAGRLPSGANLAERESGGRGSEKSNEAGRLTNSPKSPRVLSVSSPNTVLCWIYDPTILPFTAKMPDHLPELEGELVIENLAPGKWSVQRWEPFRTRASGPVARDTAKVGGDGRLALAVKAAGPDYAFRIERVDGEKTAAVSAPKLVLEPFEDVNDQGSPRARLGIPKAGKALTIDGILSDWAGAEFTTVEPRDGRAPDDGSFKFAVAHDAENLYVACEVTDDQIIRLNKGDHLWKDDCVELWIDARRDASKLNNMPTNPGLYQINLAPPAEGEARQGQPSKDGDAVEIVLYRNPTSTDRLRESIRASSRRTPKGYTIEAAIPLAVLRGAEFASKPEMGFNISICDADSKDAKTTWHHLLWLGKKEEDATQWSEATLEK